MLGRVLAGLLLAALVLFPAQAQSPIKAFPPGTFQNRASLDAATGGGGTIVFNDTANLTNNYGGPPSQTNVRVVIPSSSLTAASGSHIAVQFLFNGGGDGGYTVGTVYIGQSGGTAPNFTGDQVQVTFSGGSSTFSSLTTATSVTSDVIALAQAFDNTKSYTIAFHMPAIGGNFGGTLAFSAASNYQLAGADNSSSTTSAGMTLNSGFNVMISILTVTP